MTEVAEASTPASPRSRPARRGVGELSYRLDPDVVERLAAGEPAWLADVVAYAAPQADAPADANAGAPGDGLAALAAF